MLILCRIFPALDSTDARFFHAIVVQHSQGISYHYVRMFFALIHQSLKSNLLVQCFERPENVLNGIVVWVVGKIEDWNNS